MFEKPVPTVVRLFHAQITRTEKVTFREKYHVLMSHSENHQILPAFIENSGYKQIGREQILYKCSCFLLELGEISFELNFKALKVVSLIDAFKLSLSS